MYEDMFFSELLAMKRFRSLVFDLPLRDVSKSTTKLKILSPKQYEEKVFTYIVLEIYEQSSQITNAYFKV